MAIYTLDIAKWRCGGAEKQMGQGPTQMANRAGFMCCLGQFALKHTKRRHMVDFNTPQALATSLQKIYDPIFVHHNVTKQKFLNTELSSELMRINDAKRTSVEYKVTEIRELLRKNGHILRVRNKHLIPK